MVVWLTPAGTEDEGGVKQPAYLNFDTALLSPPHGNHMHVRALHKHMHSPLLRAQLKRQADGGEWVASHVSASSCL